jgi:thioredoxin-related protein
MKLLFSFIVFVFLFVMIFISNEKDTSAQSFKKIKNENQNYKELGRVNWLRSYSEALTKAKETNKPVLILFQEVPGCATCVGYGEQVLSHPLLTEAIETLFIPVAIFNNKSGEDAKVLEKFNEPAWNNPVVRIINANENELSQRVAGDYSLSGILSSMINALKKNGNEIPAYLKLLNEECSARESGTETAVFAMGCFWTGEVVLGSINGVIETEPGYKDGYEVVKVKFDPKIISYDKLHELADKQECALKTFPGKEISSDNEPKYYLSHSNVRYVPLTSVQSCRINSAIANGKDYKIFLSPAQVKLLDFINNNPKKGWENLIGSNNLQKDWDNTISKL